MTISIIVAMAENRVIGKDNTLPWKLPNDMKFFAETTKGHVVIMGRKNYESIPPKFRPLPQRTNIVITRQTDYDAPGCIVVNSLEAALAKARELNETECFIIGGAEIYRLALPFTDKLYITEIHAQVDGNILFPEIDWSEWHRFASLYHGKDEKHQYDFTFVQYEGIEIGEI